MSAPVRVIPLGGLGEVGKNVTVVETATTMVLVDCGLTFPREEGMFGVDIVIPDLSYVVERADRLAAVILTHGHEDHIGALPSLLRQVEVPEVLGTRFTLALAKSRADEQGLIGRTSWREVDPDGDPVRVGDIEVEGFRVSHSIPDCMGLALHTSEGTIVHSADIKLDPTPMDGVRTDLTALVEIAADGVALYLGDSTNADIPGTSGSERSVTPQLGSIIQDAPGRVIGSTFSSQIHRIQQFLNMARATDRSVCILGRSMMRNTNIARNLGYLDADGVDIVRPHQLEEIPPDRQLLLSTGSQGEPLAAMSRIAGGTHRHVSPLPDDTVIFSSRTIPGNEVRVHRVVNELSRRGAFIHHDHNSRVHVSGHGYSEELTFVLGIIEPTCFMPIHGEWRHLRAHAGLALATGVDPDNILMGENGRVVELRRGVARLSDERVPVGVHLMDRQSNEDLDDRVLDERQQLSAAGVVVAIARGSGHDVEVELVPRGLATADAASVLARAVEAAETSLAGVGVPSEDRVRTIVEDVIEDQIGTRPLVVPVLDASTAHA